jgi:hypothetical protein
MRLLFLLCLLLIGSSLSLIVIKSHRPQNSWYQSYFDTLTKKKIQSYKIISIIQPDSINKTQLTAMEDFFSAIKNQLKTNKFCNYAVELILGEHFSPELEELFNHWSENYKDFITLTPIRHAIETHSLHNFPSKFCLDSTQPYCTHLLKLWSLEDQTAYTIVLDPILWQAHYEQQKKLSSACAFGLAIDQDALAIHAELATKNDLNLFYINNKLLINQNSITQKNQLKQLKAKLLSCLEIMNPMLDHVLFRKQFLSSIPYHNYQKELMKRVDWWSHQSNLNFNERILLNFIGGDVFLTKAATEYKIPTIYMTCATKGDEHKQYVYLGEMNVATLSMLIGLEQAKEVLAFVLEYNDYAAYATDELRPYDHWEAKLTDAWGAMNPQQHHYTKMILQPSALEWLKSPL